MSQSPPPVRLTAIRDSALSVAEVLDAVSDPRAGGVVPFVGVVRDHDGGNQVSRLGYSAHPSAAERLQEVARDVAARHEVLAVAAVHRVGELAVGELAVVCAAAAAHREAAFDACRDLIDTLKSTVPIWKHQVFADGSDEWVGLP
ncbi:molybdenum cofactor biosynthesis protein MoaE [Arsenicicoccus dermatophilus]|uniref:molybdenum cofactor biosynthesis protein MoaE n=1 Tax=Arsenicicoccus dermatophilus TaxID=1076331 RepID=UPI0039175535